MLSLLSNSANEGVERSQALKSDWSGFEMQCISYMSLASPLSMSSTIPRYQWVHCFSIQENFMLHSDSKSSTDPQLMECSTQ